MTRMAKWCVVACMVMLTSCATKVAYNFMDWAIEWKVKSFVSLHGDQKTDLKRTVEQFHLWHRHTQLPQYAAYLNHLHDRLNQGPITASEIHAETDAVQLLLDQSLQKVQPDIARVMTSLNDRQVKELLASFAKHRKEYVDDYVNISTKKQIQKRYDDFYGYVKPWFGSLSPTQKQWIKQWSIDVVPYEHLNVEQQKLWEAQLAATLAQRKNLDALEKGLGELMFYRTDNWQPELEKILDKNQTLTYELIAQLVNSMSADQKRHVQKELRDYVSICQDLSKS